MVVKKLASLNVRKATGPDGISAKLLKMVAPVISPSLTSLFNYSLFPAAWKEANVTPVPKSGDNFCKQLSPYICNSNLSRGADWSPLFVTRCVNILTATTF